MVSDPFQQEPRYMVTVTGRFQRSVVWSYFFINMSRCGLGAGLVTLQANRLWPMWLVWDFYWEVL